mmetsp:Transcript_65738/g.175118  ORF Transcript_65738/g.175118 Transcript_65738/m.175118 type:complete len:384 (+) Transcript_65738:409-1560(+)
MQKLCVKLLGRLRLLELLLAQGLLLGLVGLFLLFDLTITFFFAIPKVSCNCLLLASCAADDLDVESPRRLVGSTVIGFVDVEGYAVARGEAASRHLFIWNLAVFAIDVRDVLAEDEVPACGLRGPLHDAHHAHRRTAGPADGRPLASSSLCTTFGEALAKALACAALPRLLHNLLPNGAGGFPDGCGLGGRHLVRGRLHLEVDGVANLYPGRQVIFENPRVALVGVVDLPTQDGVVPRLDRWVPQNAGQLAHQVWGQVVVALILRLYDPPLPLLLFHGAVYVHRNGRLAFAFDDAKGDCVADAHPYGATVINDLCILVVLPEHGLALDDQRVLPGGILPQLNHANIRAAHPSLSPERLRFGLLACGSHWRDGPTHPAGILRLA